MRLKRLAFSAAIVVLPGLARDPLPSWEAGPNKQAIIKFVKEVTSKHSPYHVPRSERIAAFDNDGTLWPEQPVYFEVLYAVERMKALAPKHPEWASNPA